MQSVQLQMMDPEELAAHNAAVLVENERKARARLAADNRRKGHAKPQAGDRMFVVLADRTIKRRSRASVLFTPDRRTCCVVADVPEEMKIEPGSGIDAYITPDQAEQILGDNALVVHAMPIAEADSMADRQTIAKLQAELAASRAESARLRSARQAAEDPGDGSPGRLKAAAKARGAAPDDFGGGK